MKNAIKPRINADNIRMDHISYKGFKLKIIRYSGDLYRADKLRNNTYTSAAIKFFALTEKNTNSYARNAKFIKHMKVISPSNPLILIDILDIPTRKSLSAIIGSNALDMAFPIRNHNSTIQPEYTNNMNILNTTMIINNNNSYVGRFSNSNEGNPDYDALNAICKLGVVDGYYMNAVENFHSEVGLCARGLQKIQLVNVTTSSVYIPSQIVTKKSRSRLGGCKRKTRTIRKSKYRLRK